MKILTVLCILLLSACSTQIVDMIETPTVQEYNLTDAEADGVILARDDCPESAKGAQVNYKGCGTEGIKTLRRKLEVHFDTDSYAVKAVYLSEIELNTDSISASSGCLYKEMRFGPWDKLMDMASTSLE